MPFAANPLETRRTSGVALVMLTVFFAALFPYWSGLEIPRAGIQLFYSCAAAVYLDLAMSRFRAPWSGVAAWAMAIAVQIAALAAVRLKVGHWAVPNAMFLAGAALLGLGIGIAAAYLGEFWSGQTARQIYLFTSLAVFLFWGMTPEVIQLPANTLLLPDIMPWTGLIGGPLIAALGWWICGREAAV